MSKSFCNRRVSRRPSCLFVVGLFVVCLLGTYVAAQQPAKVSTLRLYVIDQGRRPPGPRESVYPAYLIVHPSGRTLLWETGALPDAYIGTDRPREELRDALRTIVAPKP